MIDLTALNYALLVLEHGSFRKAAAVLHVRPSVVSRRIRSLEDTIGVSLFQRRSQGAEPTLAGQRILQRGRAIVDDIGQLLRAAHLSSTGSEGSLCVGIVATIAGGTARELLRAFLAAHADIDLQVVEGSPSEHIGAVRALRMDATFVVGSPPAPGCVVEPMWSEPILVALASGHPLATNEPISWSQLAAEHFVVSKADPGPEIQDFIVRKMSDLGYHPVVEPRPVRRGGLIALVGLGRGISLVGAAEADVAYPGVVFRTLEGELLPYNVVWSEQNDNPVLRRFLSLARASMKALVQHASVMPTASRVAPDAPLRTPDPPP